MSRILEEYNMKNLGASSGNIKKMIEQIDALDTYTKKLENQVPTGTANGSSIQLTDSAEGLAIENVVVGGATEQAQYEGYNLLPNTATTQTVNGVTFTIKEDKSIVANGTATATTLFPIGSMTFLANTTYKVSGCPSGGTDSTYRIDYRTSTESVSFTDYGSGGTVTKTEDTALTAKIRVNSGAVLNNVTFKPMVIKGSTEKTYEPYCGEKASPNPDYPQAIHCVTGNCNVKVQNRNLLDLTQTPILKSNYPQQVYSINGNTISITGSPNQNSGIGLIVPIAPEKEATISFDSAVFSGTNGNNNILYDFLDEVPESFENLNFPYYISLSMKKATFLTTKKYLLVVIRVGLKNSVVVTGLRVNYGSTSTDYILHAEQNAPLTLGNIELYEGDKIQISYVNQAGYKKVTGANVVKKIKERVLTGIENWISQSPTGFYRYGLNISEIINDNSLSDDVLIYSNYFKGISFADRQTDADETIYIVCNGLSGNNGFFINTKEFSTADALKTWLSTHNTIVVYPLATPTTAPITDATLLTQLETLINMETYKGITNIDTEGEDLAPVLEFTYCKDLDTIIYNLQQAVLNS